MWKLEKASWLGSEPVLGLSQGHPMCMYASFSQVGSSEESCG